MKRKRTDNDSEENPTKRRKLKESSASEKSSKESPELDLDQYKSEVVIKDAKTLEQTINFAFSKMFPPKKSTNPKNPTGEKYIIKDETDEINEKYLPK